MADIENAKKESTLFEWFYKKGYSPYQVKWYDVVIALVLFVVAAIVYIKTLTPSVCAGDSGELTTAIYNMGACHPPGYPLYSILGKLFTFIPVGDIAYRINLFSAISGAGAVLFLYLLLVKLLGLNRDIGKLNIKVHLPAIAGSILFAFSLTNWSQAVIGEVYALNILLSSAMLYIMLLWYEELIYFRKEKTLHFAERRTVLLAFIMGLSLTNHQLPMWYIAAWGLFLVLPVIMLIISERSKEFGKQLRERIGPISIFAILIVIVILIFKKNAMDPGLILEKNKLPILIAIFIIPAYLTAYTIFVKIMKPKENWVDKFLEIFMYGFWLLMFAMTVYLYMMVRACAIWPIPEPKPLSWGDTRKIDILFNHMLRKQYGRGGGGDLRNLGGQWLAVLKFHVKQIHWVNAVLAVIGVVYLFIKDKIWGIFTFFAMFILSVMLIKFVNFQVDPRTLSFQEVMYIQSFYIMAIYVAFAYQLILDLTTGLKKLIEKRKVVVSEQVE